MWTVLQAFAAEPAANPKERMGSIVDEPQHDELVRALVASGALPEALASQYPTRAQVSQKLGRGELGPEHCSVVLEQGRLEVRCTKFLGCVGACLERHVVARWSGEGPVQRHEEHSDMGLCGCCLLSE